VSWHLRIILAQPDREGAGQQLDMVVNDWSPVRQRQQSCWREPNMIFLAHMAFLGEMIAL
jgi:hypothetical protein